MALSGSVKTSSYDGRYYLLEWTATQSESGNYSTVSWALSCAGGSAGWYAERTLEVKIAGSKVYSKTDRVERRKGTIKSGTKVINHDDDGNASFDVSVRVAVFVDTVNCTGSKTFTLDQIARRSTLTVADGTLGTSMTIPVTRRQETHVHTVTATCGSADVVVLCENSTTSSLTYTPPLEWARQNTAGTSVTVVYKITTYDGEELRGTNSYTTTCSIPSSVKPSLSVSYSDTEGYLDRAENLVKGKSKLSIHVEPVIAYDSPIASYAVSVDGDNYSTQTVSTDVIKSSGKVTISVKVTDKRGRTGSWSKDIGVLEYKSPVINKLAVHRCEHDGTENDEGEYVKVTWSASVTEFEGLDNTVDYQIKYKRTNDSSWRTIYINSKKNVFEVVDADYIFEADGLYAWDVQLIVKDAYEEVSRSTKASTAYTLVHYRESGRGIAFGGMCEEDDFWCKMPAHFKRDVNIEGALYINGDYIGGTPGGTGGSSSGGDAPTLSGNVVQFSPSKKSYSDCVVIGVDSYNLDSADFPYQFKNCTLIGGIYKTNAIEGADSKAMFSLMGGCAVIGARFEANSRDKYPAIFEENRSKITSGSVVLPDYITLKGTASNINAFWIGEYENITVRDCSFNNVIPARINGAKGVRITDCEILNAPMVVWASNTIVNFDNNQVTIPADCPNYFYHVFYLNNNAVCHSSNNDFTFEATENSGNKLWSIYHLMTAGNTNTRQELYDTGSVYRGYYCHTSDSRYSKMHLDGCVYGNCTNAMSSNGQQLDIEFDGCTFGQFNGIAREAGSGDRTDSYHRFINCDITTLNELPNYCLYKDCTIRSTGSHDMLIYNYTDLYNCHVIITGTIKRIFVISSANVKMHLHGNLFEFFATNTDGGGLIRCATYTGSACFNTVVGCNSSSNLFVQATTSSENVAYNNVNGIYSEGGQSGSGSSTVTVTRKVSSGTNIADITVNGTTTQLYAPSSSGSNVTVTNRATEGTRIATINIDGSAKDIYAPNSEATTVTVTPAITSGTKIADINVNGTNKVLYAPSGGASGGSTVSVDRKLSSGTNIADITINGTTTKLYAPNASSGSGGDKVTMSNVSTTGTTIATITINGVAYDIKAPTSTSNLTAMEGVSF